MPYIDSNQDANQNDLFSKALAVGAVAIGAAAAGQMAFKSIAEKWGSGLGKVTEGKHVLKGLYGKEAGNLQKGIVDDVPIPSWTKDGPQYKLINNGNKAPKFNRTDGSAWQRFKSNKLSPTWSVGDGWGSKFMKPADKELAMFNSQLKNIHNGNFEGYSDSKLSMYKDLVSSAENNNINITGRDAVQATNKMYSSDKNFFNRKNAGVDNLADDVDITNELWNNSKKAESDKAKFQSDVKSEISNRATAEANARKAEQTVLDNIGVKLPKDNSPMYEKQKKSYEDFWQNADLSKTQPRHPKESTNGADTLMDLQHSSGMYDKPSGKAKEITNGTDLLQSLQPMPEQAPTPSMLDGLPPSDVRLGATKEAGRQAVEAKSKWASLGTPLESSMPTARKIETPKHGPLKGTEPKYDLDGPNATGIFGEAASGYNLRDILKKYAHQDNYNELNNIPNNVNHNMEDKYAERRLSRLENNGYKNSQDYENFWGSHVSLTGDPYLKNGHATRKSLDSDYLNSVNNFESNSHLLRQNKNHSPEVSPWSKDANTKMNTWEDAYKRYH